MYEKVVKQFRACHHITVFARFLSRSLRIVVDVEFLENAIKTHIMSVQVALISAVGAIGVIAASLCAPAFPAIASFFSVGPETLQFAISLFLMGNALGQLVSGLLADLFGERRLMLLGLSLFVAASFVCGTANSMLVLVVGRFFQGMGSAVGPVLARAIAISHFPREKSSQAISYGAFVVGLISIFAILLSGELSLFSWRYNFFLAALIGLFLMLSTLFVLRARTQSHHSLGLLGASLGMIQQVVRQRVFLVNAMLHSITYGLMYAYIALFPFLCEKFYGRNTAAAVGWGSAFMIAVYLVGVLFTAHMHNDAQRRRWLKRGIYLQGLSGALLLLVSGFVQSLAALVLLNLSIGFILPLSASIALQPFSQQGAGTASSLLGTTYRCIGAALTLLIGNLGIGAAENLGVALLLLSPLSAALLMFEGTPSE